MSEEESENLKKQLREVKVHMERVRANLRSTKASVYETLRLSNRDTIMLNNLQIQYNKSIERFKYNFESEYEAYFGQLEVEREWILFDFKLYTYQKLPNFNLLQFYFPEGNLINDFRQFVDRNSKVLQVAYGQRGDISFFEFNEIDNLILGLDYYNKMDLYGFVFFLLFPHLPGSLTSEGH